MKRLTAIGVLTACALFVANVSDAGQDRNLKRAEAYVDTRCPAQTREIAHVDWEPSVGFNALYGNCRAGDGRDQHIWFFHGGRFVGLDAATSSHWITPIWRDNTTIAFMYTLYRQFDPECCPTGGGAIVRFRWSNGKLKRLDSLPPRAFARGVKVGR